MGCSSSTTALPPPDEPRRKVDPRLPYTTYRQLFSMKNWWKAVTRALEDTAKDNLIRLLAAHPEYRNYYPDIAHITEEEKMRTSLAFETTSSDMFTNLDEVMTHLEGVDNAVILLNQIGRMHQNAGFPLEYFTHMRVSFLGAVKNTLGDRYTDSCEDSFEKLYAFFLQHIREGYGSTE